MADLYEVDAGQTALAEDVNQYKDALEGGSVQQFALFQKSGADFTIRMATANGTDKVSFQDSGGNEVASINSDGEATFTDVSVDGFVKQEVARNESNFTANSNTTLANVTGLSFGIGASEVYRVECDLQCSANASGGLKVAFSVPSGAAVTGVVMFNAAAATVNTRSSDLTTASGSTSAVVYVRVVATVVNSSTAGTVQLQAAQNGSHASDSIIYAQSTLVATRLN